jgi:hypothetical protein
MGYDECKECERDIETLNDNGMELDLDGFCSECGPKLYKEWKDEKLALERDWRSERL